MNDFDFAKGFDIFKALTPFILALIVYLVWHKQKEKEVIAIEAKNSMITLNEILALIDDVFSLFKGSDLNKLNEDEKKTLKNNIKQKFEVLNLKKNNLLYSMIFIADAKADKDFHNLIFAKDRKLMLDLFNLGRIMTLSLNKMNHTEESLEELNIKIYSYRSSIVESIHSTKKNLVGYALYRK
ncbi:hypothetical protein [Acinetobacter proteolyticus]|uniref:Uncharacterized protein n=1 Tax=Acinetobacter proteolyticus TaxID=1776741 RepID=A0A2N0WBR3_9GAMM|nr:hypothetical protein [Acinetobacter proteolyticus]PKF31944.1 hypothetical protein CW311_17055 [Acinetobacter proteolyticus]